MNVNRYSNNLLINTQILTCKVLNYLSLKGNCAQTVCMVTAQLCSQTSGSFVPKQVVFLVFVCKPVPPNKSSTIKRNPYILKVL